MEFHHIAGPLNLYVQCGESKATAASSLTSTGEFVLQRKGTRILVTGAITHVWTDDGYDFNTDDPFHEESQVLERHGKAKPFQWKAEWEDGILGELQIENAFSPNATRRWISFEVNTLS